MFVDDMETHVLLEATEARRGLARSGLDAPDRRWHAHMSNLVCAVPITCRGYTDAALVRPKCGQVTMAHVSIITCRFVCRNAQGSCRTRLSELMPHATLHNIAHALANGREQNGQKAFGRRIHAGHVEIKCTKKCASNAE